ncbi:carbohydrate ABC transporter permease [Anaerocolumna chitinilytica]|uniref:ABC transporter permease n=1 Tax=Anaerocolumna chitinilytica TaxID=1727145 RepID=A0A7I8DRX9_9FIRM|nr:sugar ABC transporter permease [Anaerocolumna chitinilytica]BCJ99036.1 ABC transporter permease [Anaerocolumna chitinilytica]
MEAVGRRERILTRKQRQSRRAYAVILPFFIYIAIWSLLPLVIGLLLGFTDFNALNGLPKWVGLKNFTTFFSSKDYLTLLGRQMWMGSLCLVANVVLSFMLALALNIKHPLRGFFRTSVYIPNIAAAAITSGVFIALLNPFNGGINMFFKSLGMDPIIWNYSQFWMVFWIIVFFVWRSAGPAAIIWLGGLQSIDPSLYEAAKVDGAGRFQQILYITIPGLRFIAAYILLTGLIGVMQMFDVVMLISHGNPYGKTDVLMYRIYRDGVVSFNMGMAGAASTVLGLVTIVIAFLVFIVISKGDNNE